MLVWLTFRYFSNFSACKIYIVRRVWYTCICLLREIAVDLVDTSYLLFYSFEDYLTHKSICRSRKEDKEIKLVSLHLFDIFYFSFLFALTIRFSNTVIKHNNLSYFLDLWNVAFVDYFIVDFVETLCVFDVSFLFKIYLWSLGFRIADTNMEICDLNTARIGYEISCKCSIMPWKEVSEMRKKFSEIGENVFRYW